MVSWHEWGRRGLIRRATGGILIWGNTVVCPTRGLGWALNGSSPGSASSTISGTQSRFHGWSTASTH